MEGQVKAYIEGRISSLDEGILFKGEEIASSEKILAALRDDRENLIRLRDGLAELIA